jgi:hypothetical protein
VFRSWSSALVAASALLVVALPVHAAPDASLPTSVRASGFSYGAILNTLDDAPLARVGGFTLISAYVAWQAVEPTRGQYRFEQHD